MSAHSALPGTDGTPCSGAETAPLLGSDDTFISSRRRWACERFDQLARLLIGVLHGRRLHEIGGGPLEGAADAAVERDLCAAHRVDDDAGRVRRVPDLQLELEVQRDV